MFKIGSHVGMSGNKMFLGSVEEAISYGANTFMIYPSAIENLETVNESTKRLYQSFMLYDNPVIQIVGIKKRLKVR